jgi:alpha,alpha-trehalase
LGSKGIVVPSGKDLRVSIPADQRRRTAAALIDAGTFEAVLFDLDGVLTDTAIVHAAAWKRLFDEALHHMEATTDRRPFDTEDYLRHVDGRSRLDGVETFLSSRGIRLPRGTPQDPPGSETSWGLANRKETYFLAALSTHGAHAFPGSATMVRRVRAAGLRTGVVTASRHRAEVLSAAGIDDLFDVHVDGNDAATLQLAGKPDPAMFLEAARRLNVEPRNTVVIEDALAGVRAGRRGRFGRVIGVDRGGDAEAFASAGADTVVSDLTEIDVKDSIREPRR